MKQGAHFCHGLLKGVDRRDVICGFHEEEGTIPLLKSLVQTAEIDEADRMKLRIPFRQNASEELDRVLGRIHHHAKKENSAP